MPRWRTGETLELVSATVQTGATFTYTPPRVLFPARPSIRSSSLNLYLYSYAPSHDGQRFLVNVVQDSPRGTHLLTNWRRLLNPDAKKR